MHELKKKKEKAAEQQLSTSNSTLSLSSFSLVYIDLKKKERGTAAEL